MLKDIQETSKALKKLLKSYFSGNNKIININFPTTPGQIEKIYIAASGSSRNAANIARYFLEEILNIPVIVEYAGEFANRNSAISTKDMLIALSQSGETADVLAAVKKAKKENLCVFSITNNSESSIHLISDEGMLLYAGLEESIPATKTFICQLMALYLVGIHLAEQRKSCNESELSIIKQHLTEVPDKLSVQMTELLTKTSSIVEKIKSFNTVLVLGRGQNAPIAEEGALKIQETSFINAFGWPSGEFMHGHIALANDKTLVISILTRSFKDNNNYNLAKSNIEEIKNRKNPFLVIIGSNSDNIKGISDVFIEIKEQQELIAPFLAIVSLQIIAYKLAEATGKDTKSPEGLTKTVYSE